MVLFATTTITNQDSHVSMEMQVVVGRRLQSGGLLKDRMGSCCHRLTRQNTKVLCVVRVRYRVKVGVEVRVRIEGSGGGWRVEVGGVGEE